MHCHRNHRNPTIKCTVTGTYRNLSPEPPEPVTGTPVTGTPKAESFMKTLKTEELNARCFKGINDASLRIDDFIANIYNTERLHSALGYRSPLEFEAAFAQSKNN